MPEPTALTVGTFDGVHRGHQQIFAELLAVAKAMSLAPAVVTFEPHPQEVVATHRHQPIRLLTDLPRKAELIKAQGIETIVVLPFDHSMAAMRYDEFVDSVLREKLLMEAMVVGHDHALGRNREGRWEHLQPLAKERKFRIHRVDAFVDGGERISSSAIRRSLENGQVDLAAKMLGRYFSLSGAVVRGDGRGHELNYPTANLGLDNDKLQVPHFGVYAVFVKLAGKRYRGMLNIGKRPTFNHSDMTIEVHIFDFDGSIYGEMLRVEFVAWLRAERKFAGREELMAQLENDEEKSKEIFKMLEA
jgi:riboflavin kinase/FMN adenylyltransferase